MSDTKQKNQKQNKPAAPVAETLPNVEMPVVATPVEQPAAQPVVPADPQTLRISLPAKDKKTQRKISCIPGQIYRIALGEGATAVQVPFQLPRQLNDSEPVAVDVVIASENPNWLGRDGEELRIHVCSSDVGTVILQPHGKGWKANVFSTGRVTHAAVTV